jgi:uncharacterized protein (TIGR02145 family)
MKNLFALILLSSSFAFFCIACQPTVPKTSKRLPSKSFEDSRDNQTYITIKIERQLWMAENLRYAAKGSWINPENPKTQYGRLYNWETAKNACPKGWHLPSDEDWKELEFALGMSHADADTKGWRGVEGLNLKSKRGWNEKGNGNNSSGFNVLPTGDCNARGGFLGLGKSTSFWTATLDGTSGAWHRHFDSTKDGINRYVNNVKIGLSCRCLKD